MTRNDIALTMYEKEMAAALLRSTLARGPVDLMVNPHNGAALHVSCYDGSPTVTLRLPQDAPCLEVDTFGVAFMASFAVGPASFTDGQSIVVSHAVIPWEALPAFKLAGSTDLVYANGRALPVVPDRGSLVHRALDEKEKTEKRSKLPKGWRIIDGDRK